KIPKHRRGPSHGLAVGMKHVMNTKGHARSTVCKGHHPGSNASIVSILRAAGVLISGLSTITTGFLVANSGPYTTIPQDPCCTPGASSCGSAAAVAEPHIPVALGADTGGN
ncbi:hypothetical protein K491DRAFT_581937, partial [Lophiostoma macrostomum CBS 122681]